MRTHSVRRLAVATIVAAFALANAAAANSAEITDSAGFFSRNALDKANAELATLRREYGKDVRIETFETVPGGRADEVAKMDRSERARFFDKWARDRATAERVKGIYLLICRHPGHVQVEVDRQTRDQRFGDAERDKLRDILLAGFKHKDYDKALLDTVAFVRETMHKRLRPHAESIGAPGAQPDRNEPRDTEPAGRQPARGMGWLGWIVVALIVLVGIRLVAALFSAISGGNRPAGYPGSGYGPGYGGYGGGGGIMGSMMSGLFGAMAGNWIYNSFFGPTAHASQPGGFGGIDSERNIDRGAGEDFEGTGGDFDDRGDASNVGGDFAESGGDFGADNGGGDFGGGDFGGGNSGGDGGGDF